MTVAAEPRQSLGCVCRVAPESELEAFAVDGLIPAAVVQPESAEQVSAVVKLAAEHHLAVIPWGGGTQMGLGNVPRRADVVMCTSALNQVQEYEPADLVVTVQAGVRLAELQSRLAEHGQTLALDPPLPDRATVGGIISGNASGPLRLRHGTVRDVLLGVKVVNADGAMTKGGGKVVKNVTGYDMCKLYTGSLGTLGVIVEASFKLTPLPALERTVLASFSGVSAACEAARSVYRSALPVRACELFSPGAANVLQQDLGKGLAGQAPAPSEDGSGWLLLVRVGGGQAAVQRQSDDVLAMCSGAKSSRVIEGSEVARLWRAVQDFGREDFEMVAKLSSQPSRTGELLERLPAASVFVSHVLSGVTYVFGHQAEVAARAARASGGYAVFEACPAEAKSRLDVWGPVGADFKLMQRIKREFDPDGILNPGRYVGGL